MADDLECLSERRLVAAFLRPREGAREQRSAAHEQLIEFGARRWARDPDRERAAAFLGVLARDLQRTGGISRGEDSTCGGERTSHRSGAAEGASRERDRHRSRDFSERELTDGAVVVKASAFEGEGSGFQGGSARDRRRATRQYEAVATQAVFGSGVRAVSRGSEGAVVPPSCVEIEAGGQRDRARRGHEAGAAAELEVRIFDRNRARRHDRATRVEIRVQARFDRKGAARALAEFDFFLLSAGPLHGTAYFQDLGSAHVALDGLGEGGQGRDSGGITEVDRVFA